MTAQEVRRLVLKHGSLRAAAKASGLPRTTLSRWLNGGKALHPEVRRNRAPAKAVCGIALAGMRVSVRKPADSVRGLIYGLKRGYGYPLAALSQQWNISEDTIRSHAKRLECFKYVEQSPGQWTPCVTHPDTATECDKERA